MSTPPMPPQPMDRLKYRYYNHDSKHRPDLLFVSRAILGYRSPPLEASHLDHVDLTNINLEASADQATPWYLRFPGYRDRFYNAQIWAFRHFQHSAGRQLTDSEITACHHAVVHALRDGKQSQAAAASVLVAGTLWVLSRRHRAASPTRLLKLTGRPAILSRLTIGAAICYTSVKLSPLFGSEEVLSRFDEEKKQAPALRELLRSMSNTSRPAFQNQLLENKRLPNPPGISPLDEVDLSLIDAEETRIDEIKRIISKEQHYLGRRMTPEEVLELIAATQRAETSAKHVGSAVFWTCFMTGSYLFLARGIPQTKTPFLRLTGVSASRSRTFWRIIYIGFGADIAQSLAQLETHRRKLRQYVEESPSLEAFRQDVRVVTDKRVATLRQKAQGMHEDSSSSQSLPFPEPQPPKQYDDDSPAASMSDGWETSDAAPRSQTQSTEQIAYPEQQPPVQEQQASAPPDDFWDDASPTSSDKASSRPEDTWDRIRRQAAKERGQGRAGGRQDTSDKSGDPLAFSDSDAKREPSKSKAQREFDARIERERQGRDFDGQSRGGSSGNW